MRCKILPLGLKKGVVMEMKLEVIMLPVSDVDKAKEFYKKLGFREDIDTGGESRVVQFTPPGSGASIFIGNSLTGAEPGSVKGLVLVVDDIEAAHKELTDKEVEVTQIFHGPAGLFYYADNNSGEIGPEPERQSYFSFTAFSDPDGNGWLVQEVTTRLPGRV
jgi:catechol 2,3-dioxygenase-like lactoylglutathione lyase family enzyme